MVNNCGTWLDETKTQDVFTCLLNELRGKRVAVVGHFHNLERLSAICELSILERKPMLGDMPDPACEYILAEQDVVIMTATTLINKTMPRLLELSRNARVVVAGPSTPLHPLMFDHGVDLLGGLIVDDAAFGVASRGGRWSRGSVQARRTHGEGVEQAAGLRNDLEAMAAAGSTVQEIAEEASRGAAARWQRPRSRGPADSADRGGGCLTDDWQLQAYSARLVECADGPSARAETAGIVLLQVRFPRLLAAMLVGGGLALAGAAYQGLFNNPMVSPDILGASAGAGFGAALGILFGLHVVAIRGCHLRWDCWRSPWPGRSAQGLCRRGDPVLMLVLVGILIASVFTALISFTKYLADPYDRLPAITYWLIGAASPRLIPKISNCQPCQFLRAAFRSFFCAGG